MSSAFDANRYATSSYLASSSPGADSSASAPAFRAPVFEPPPSFDFDTATSAAPLPPVIAVAEPGAYHAPASRVQFHSPGPAHAPAEVQLVPLGRAGAAGDVRSITAFAHASTPSRIARFEFDLRSGESLFAPRHFDNSGDLRPAGRWELLDGESLACAYVLADLRGASPAAWLFETSAQRMSIVFGAASGSLTVRSFDCGRLHGAVGVEKLCLRGSGDSSGALPPISSVSSHSGKNNHAPSSLQSVEIETDSSGVNKIAFVHLPGHSNDNESYGFHASGGSAESFQLQDAGTANAEIVAEVICVQDSQRLHAIQVVSSRGRRSDWNLRGEWKSFRLGKLARTVDEMGDELQREARALALASDVTSKKPSTDSDSVSDESVVVVAQPGNAQPANEDDAPDAKADDDEEGERAFYGGCAGYIFGMMVIALFTYGCAATAYMYSYGTTLSIWLGVFLPCAVICGLAGLANFEDGVVPKFAAYCAGTWVVGLLIGLIGGIYFLAPWWMLTSRRKTTTIVSTFARRRSFRRRRRRASCTG